MDIICYELFKYVMIFLGDYVYCMDYGGLFVKYVEIGVDMIVCCIEVLCEEVVGIFGVMIVDENNRVCCFDEKLFELILVLGKLGICLVLMGNYIFNIEFLFEQLKKDVEIEGFGCDFGYDIILVIIEEYNVFVYLFRDENEGQLYWCDVGILDLFWEVNMEFVMLEFQFDLYDFKWLIWIY